MVTASPNRIQETEIVERALGQAVARVLQLPADAPVDPDTSFADLGLDSVAGIAVATQVAEELSIRVPPVLMFDFPTVRELSHHLVLMRLNRD
jgi:acyl carrier protein